MVERREIVPAAELMFGTKGQPLFNEKQVPEIMAKCIAHRDAAATTESAPQDNTPATLPLLSNVL